MYLTPAEESDISVTRPQVNPGKFVLAIVPGRRCFDVRSKILADGLGSRSALREANHAVGASRFQTKPSVALCSLRAERRFSIRIFQPAELRPGRSTTPSISWLGFLPSPD